MVVGRGQKLFELSDVDYERPHTYKNERCSIYVITGQCRHTFIVIRFHDDWNSDEHC